MKDKTNAEASVAGIVNQMPMPFKNSGKIKTKDIWNTKVLKKEMTDSLSFYVL